MYEDLAKAWTELTAPGAQFEIVETELRGNPIRTYKNAPPTLRAIWSIATAHADRDYLVYGDERWTYAEAERDVASIANWLFAQGVQPGDRVAIALRNYPEWLLAYWACVSVGVAVVGVNAWWTGPELAYGMEDSDPKVVIADRERIERLMEQPDCMKGRLLVAVRACDEGAGLGEGRVAWSTLLEQGGTLPDVDVDPDSDACIFYTSGTTGRPKGAQLTHRGCCSNVMSMAFANTVQSVASQAYAARTGAAPASSEAPTPNGGPVALVATPLFHVTANTCVALSMTLAGGAIVHMYKWEPGEALRLVEKERVTAFSGVPTMAREMITHPDREKFDLSSLKTLAGGGAQVQPDLVRAIDDTPIPARPSTGYGMTETCGIITSIGADFFVDRPDSAGRAMPCYEARIIDSEGTVLGFGDVGELCVRGAQVIKGYLNRPEETAEAIEDGWLRTGDIARLDADGFIYIVDRAKDMVIRGGENIYCAEVEAAIYEIEGVSECVVFGVDDDRLGEEVGTAIYAADPAKPVDPDLLRATLSEQLAKFKVPRYVWLLSEPLPRNASGKFVKRTVKEEVDIVDAL